jgi:hypothetical protein
MRRNIRWLLCLGILTTGAAVDANDDANDVPDGGPPEVVASVAAVFGAPGPDLNNALGGLVGTPFPGAAGGTPVDAMQCPKGMADVVDLHGLCSAGHTLSNEPEFEERGARPVGDVAEYNTTIELVGTPMRLENGQRKPGTYVRIRSNAVFNADDLENVLGHADTGGCVLASGPLKDGAINGGIGFAVRVRDARGKLCRGYVSETVVRK